MRYTDCSIESSLHDDRGTAESVVVGATGLLDLVLTAADMRHAQASACALFLLRNLALAAESKVHFVANPRALPVLLAAAYRAGQNAQNAEAGAYAAAALWALVYQGEKVPASPAQTLHFLLQDTSPACALHPFTNPECRLESLS